MATEEGLKESDKGARQARTAFEANLEVIELVGSTTTRTHMITLATQQQRGASQQVAATMRDLQIVASDVATASGQIATAVQDLRTLATELHQPTG